MNFHFKTIVGLLLLLAVMVLAGKLAGVPVAGNLIAQSEVASPAKRVLGPVVSVSEEETAMRFLARVDTGARTCSLHTAEKQILNGGEFMEDNVGKTVRFRVENRQGESQWLERPIAEVRVITTSEGEETRYMVPVTLTVAGVEREVLVSLNDRSRMSYSMLLGRNFLEGKFVVDVTGADDGPSLLARGL
ncbi:MAG: RimK/LysX family protein [Planctomycetota bacterium]